MVEKQSVQQPTENIEISQARVDAQEQERKKKVKTERVKATFHVLDHLLNIYNSSETYIKRGITLFGLGSVIAGVSFGAGQQINSTQSANTEQKVVSTPPTPSVIYLQVPANHNSTGSTPINSLPQPSNVTARSTIESKPFVVETPQPNNSNVAPQQVQKVESTPPQPNNSNVESITNELQEVKKVVKDVEEIANIAAPLKDLF